MQLNWKTSHIGVKIRQKHRTLTLEALLYLYFVISSYRVNLNVNRIEFCCKSINQIKRLADIHVQTGESILWLKKKRLKRQKGPRLRATFLFSSESLLEKSGPLQLSVVRVITEESGTMATLPSALQQGHFPSLSVFFLTFSLTTHMGPPAIKTPKSGIKPQT